jgi:methionine-S-sulfoxide reductase
MEAPFDILPGVLATTSGYTGGTLPRPASLQVGTGTTGHVEAVQVLYDTSKVTYDQLLDAFWRACDPTDSEGQFVDRGSEYTTAIFYHDDAQRAAAEASRDKLQASGVFGPGVTIVTAIRPAKEFWPAEQYHQNYYQRKNRYQTYRFLSGRDAFLARVWGEDFVKHEQEAAKEFAARAAEERAKAGGS